MCGRFTNEMTWSDIHALYKLSDELHPVPKSNMQPRYNIAPTQDVDFVHLHKAGNRDSLYAALAIRKGLALSSDRPFSLLKSAMLRS
ncbi:MAG TPA: SOS response-associated peptidase family protein [Ramlibacter sp.]|jgi:putative SOS response-associated peptidase YedK